MKQTAVEWLEEQLWVVCRPDLFEQAKQMEKEQIINAALYGFRRDSDGDDWQGDNYNAEKYYVKTFKSE